MQTESLSDYLERRGWVTVQTGPDEWKCIKFGAGGKPVAYAGDATWAEDVARYEKRSIQELWEVVKSFRGGDEIMIADPEARLECPGSGGAMSLTRSVCRMGWSGTPEWERRARLIADAPATAAERDRLHEVNRELVSALESADEVWADGVVAAYHTPDLRGRVNEAEAVAAGKVKSALAKAKETP